MGGRRTRRRRRPAGRQLASRIAYGHCQEGLRQRSRHPAFSAVGLIAVSLLFAFVVVPTSPHTPQRRRPGRRQRSPRRVRRSHQLQCCRTCSEWLGSWKKAASGQDSRETAAWLPRWVTPCLSECARLALGDARIVRSDPVAGAELSFPSGSFCPAPGPNVVLFVDRSAGEPCDPPPPPPPLPPATSPSSPGDTDIDIPYVPPPYVPHHHTQLQSQPPVGTLGGVDQSKADAGVNHGTAAQFPGWALVSFEELA